jgi:hypothetical protein
MTEVLTLDGFDFPFRRCFLEGFSDDESLKLGIVLESKAGKYRNILEEEIRLECDELMNFDIGKPFDSLDACSGKYILQGLDEDEEPRAFLYFFEHFGVESLDCEILRNKGDLPFRIKGRAHFQGIIDDREEKHFFDFDCPLEFGCIWMGKELGKETGSFC